MKQVILHFLKALGVSSGFTVAVWICWCIGDELSNYIDSWVATWIAVMIFISMLYSVLKIWIDNE